MNAELCKPESDEPELGTLRRPGVLSRLKGLNKLNNLGNFVVSIVVVKDIASGITTQNKLYKLDAVDVSELNEKAIRLAQVDFPEYRMHTVCYLQLNPSAG